MIVKVGKRKIALYLSGRHPAGENLAKILKMRSEGLDKPIQMAETAEMSASERLRYHQENSGLVMKDLKEWIEEQFSKRLVEPNGNLGKALQYWLNHWNELTTWLREPGAQGIHIASGF